MRTGDDYIAKPIRSLQTMLRVIAAADGSIPSVVPDGIYGPDTRASVAAFQACCGLPVTGMTDNDTWNHVADAFSRLSASVLPAAPLRIVLQPHQHIDPGAHNRHLYLMQAMFAALRESFCEIPDVPIDGTHGEASVAAVRWLQAKAGLAETGQIDQTVWEYLAGLYTLTEGDGCIPGPCDPPSDLLE